MPQPTDSALPRRRFLQTLTLAGLTTAVGPALAFAQAATPPPGGAAPPPAAPADTTAKAGPPKPEPPSEDAKALAGIIERRYGKQLTKEQLESITRDLDGDLQGSKRLRAAKLANGDEPDVIFEADRWPGHGA
jgi:hypothetical protein